MIDIAKEPRRAYEILLMALERMCSHDPLIVSSRALVADTEAVGPDLLPAPLMAVRGKGLIAMSVQDDFELPTKTGWKISAGDTLMIDLNITGEPGDVILIGQESDEFTICSLGDNGALVPLRDNYDFDPKDCLELGVVVEARRLSSAGKRVLDRKAGGQ